MTRGGHWRTEMIGESTQVTGGAAAGGGDTGDRRGIKVAGGGMGEGRTERRGGSAGGARETYERRGQRMTGET